MLIKARVFNKKALNGGVVMRLALHFSSKMSDLSSNSTCILVPATHLPSFTSASPTQTVAMLSC